jgi:hypothetical protein
MRFRLDRREFSAGMITATAATAVSSIPPVALAVNDSKIGTPKQSAAFNRKYLKVKLRLAV